MSGVTHLTVPEKTPAKYVDILRTLGYSVAYPEKTFFNRAVKSSKEFGDIKEATNVTAKLIRYTISIIVNSDIKNNILYFDNDILTSEKLKRMVKIYAIQFDYAFPAGMIIACRKDSAQPHNVGEGPLFANQPIIIDLFPQSEKTGIFGDLTRTVCGGTATLWLIKMHQDVLRTKTWTQKFIKPGTRTGEITRISHTFLKNLGYGKQIKHSNWHGLGLNVHEPPSFRLTSEEALEEGNVITDEPGLYEDELGGVRDEDVLYITKNRFIDLSERLPHYLEI